MNSASRQFFSGFRAELPILLGVFPFGMIYGVLALDAGLTSVESQAMSAIIFAGSSQIVATQLIHAGTPALVVILTIAVVNLRHMLYSASLAPYLQKLKPAWKWLLAYLLTDEAYAVTVIHYQKTDRQMLEGPSQGDPAEPFDFKRLDHRHWFFLGAGITLWSAWQLSSMVGILLGAVIPEDWSLDFTLSLTFIALMVPNLKDRAGIAAALSAGVAALLVFSFPYKLGLLIAALVGICCGMLVEGKP